MSRKIYSVHTSIDDLYDLLDAEGIDTSKWITKEYLEKLMNEGGLPSGDKFTTTTPTSVALGGLPAGSNINGLTMMEVMSRILFPYQAPGVSVSISPSSTLYEVGASVAINVNVSLTKKSEKITSSSLLQNNSVIKQATSVEIDTNRYSMSNVVISNDVTFKARVSDGKSNVESNTVSIRFTDKSFYGVINDGEIVDTAGEIEALTTNVLKGDKSLSWNNVNSTNQKIVYAYPKSFGDLTSIKDANNFEYLSSFDKSVVTRKNIDYNVYTLRDPISITGATLTFK